ncbi:MAG: hypothetical protein ABI818_15915, partial [Acidobacteriota bacterium]
GRYLVEKPIEEPHAPGDEYGSVAVTIADESVADLVVRTAAPGTLRGRVSFDTGLPPPDMKGEDFGVSAGTEQPGFFAASQVQTDWTFTIEDITHPARIALSGWWNDWELKEVTLGGVDATDALLSTGDVEVVLTRANAMISGVVIDDPSGTRSTRGFARSRHARDPRPDESRTLSLRLHAF